MLVSEILIARGCCSRSQIDDMLASRQGERGSVAEALVELGAATREQVDEAHRYIPPVPTSLQDTGLSPNFLLMLLLKTMHVAGFDRPTELAAAIRLPLSLTQELLDLARELKCVEILGLSGQSLVSEMRHRLTELGRRTANEALELSQYVGACPVPLEDYCTRVRQQSILNEPLYHEALLANTRHMILPDGYIEEIGPAVNSGRSLLLYGPSGNGKTTIAEAVGAALSGLVFVPHAVEVDGQIIKVFDPSVHHEVVRQQKPEISIRSAAHVDSERADERWAACVRPTMVVGGELTLEMLDLQFSPYARFYEAPLQMKAMNGVFIIDDFGRQRVSPKELLNRWIINLERRVDHLALRTGKKFTIPFDELVIFSTNLKPEDLMDDAFLRRIPYKVEVSYPTPENYRKIFELVASDAGLPFEPDVIDHLEKNFYAVHNLPLSAHHPKFIVDRLVDRCRFRGQTPCFSDEGLNYALRNLLARAQGEWGPAAVNDGGTAEQLSRRIAVI